MIPVLVSSQQKRDANINFGSTFIEACGSHKLLKNRSAMDHGNEKIDFYPVAKKTDYIMFDKEGNNGSQAFFNVIRVL